MMLCEYPRDYRLKVSVAVSAILFGLPFLLGGLAIVAFSIIDFFPFKGQQEVGFQNSRYKYSEKK